MCSPSLKIMSVVSVTIICLLPAQATLYGCSHGELCPWTSTAPGVSNLELKLQGKSKTSLLSQAFISSLNRQQEGLLCSDRVLSGSSLLVLPAVQSPGAFLWAATAQLEHLKDLFCSHRHYQRDAANQTLTLMALHVPCEYHVCARLLFFFVSLMAVITLIIPLLTFLHLFHPAAQLRADCPLPALWIPTKDYGYTCFPTEKEVSGASEALCSCVRSPGMGRLMSSVTQGRWGWRSGLPGWNRSCRKELPGPGWCPCCKNWLR